MKKFYSILLALALLTAFSVTTAFAGDTTNYIVLADSTPISSELIASIEAAGGTIERIIPEIGVLVVSGDSAFASTVSAFEDVAGVFEDYVTQWLEPEETYEVTVDVNNPPFTGNDDFFFDLLWGMDAIDALEAWDSGARGTGVRVAVLDSGMDGDNPDLAPNINYALSTSFVPGEDWWVRDGNFFNHGTHVAGTIAAADNAWGVIGVAPEAELVAVKVLSEYTGSGPFSGVIEGIVYAANIDADVINMSLGAYFDRSIYGSESALLLAAMNRATNYAFQQGTLVVVSAGNNGADRDHDQDWLVLPADATHVLAVSATSPLGWALDPANAFLDVPTYYTNYGKSAIDFAAPGGSIYFSIMPGGLDPCTVIGITRSCYVFDLVFSTSAGGTDGIYPFYWAQCTSMAAPHVSGSAALIIGANGGQMNPAHVMQALGLSADDLGKPGKDAFYGGGRVNIGNYFE